MIEENDAEVLKKAILDYLKIPEESSSIRIRKRKVFVKTNKQDARGLFKDLKIHNCDKVFIGDAISLVFNSMIVRFLKYYFKVCI
jgi:hypothetical protein